MLDYKYFGEIVYWIPASAFYHVGEGATPEEIVLTQIDTGDVERVSAHDIDPMDLEVVDEEAIEAPTEVITDIISTAFDHPRGSPPAEWLYAMEFTEVNPVPPESLPEQYEDST